MISIHKKLLIALLIAALLLPVLAGCDNTPADQTGDTTPAEGDSVTTPVTDETTASTVFNGEFIPLTNGSEPLARIVFNAKGGDAAVSAAKSIHATVKTLTGVDLGIYSSATASDYSGVDILVNVPGRAETTAALEGLSLGEYRLGVFSGAVVIASNQDAAVADAAEELCSILKETVAADGSAGVYDQMNKTGVYNLPLSLIQPEKSAESTTVYYNGDESYTVTFAGIEKATYDKYNAALVSSGMTEYTKSDLNGNYFVTYTGKDCVVNSVFVAYRNEMCLITEPLSSTALPPLESDTDPNAVKVQPMITQIGLEVPGNTSDYTNGMSYLIRMADGRFIVIDGGHPRAENAGNLFKILRAQATDPNKIVIAAWIISHAHTDHAGMFRHFHSYGKYMTVEKFIFDFPDIEKTAENKVMVEYITGIKNEISKNYPNATVYKAHVGQKYVIGDAKIDILYSMELLTPSAADLVDGFNLTSLMFSLELEGDKMMFLGDCMLSSSEVMTKMYGKTLDSDFVQVGHHGATGATAELYANISPNYALWPISDYKYGASYKMAAQNAYFRVNKEVKQVCVAGDNVWTAALDTDEPVFAKYDSVNAYLSGVQSPIK